MKLLLHKNSSTLYRLTLNATYRTCKNYGLFPKALLTQNEQKLEFNKWTKLYLFEVSTYISS